MPVSLLNFSQEQERQITSRFASMQIYREGCNYQEKYEECIVLSKFFNRFSDSCLYNSYGEYIDLSCIGRGQERKKKITQAPKQIEPQEFKLKRLSKKCIYIGSFVAHWGHLLTECLSRVWFLRDNFQEYEDYYLIYGGRINPIIAQFLSYLEIDQSRLIHVNSDLIIDEVIIPYPSMSNRGEIYLSHSEIFQTIGNRMMSDINYSETDRPLYLSRTRLPKRKRIVKGEEYLEDYLVEIGANVEYFEHISLREQLFLINRHRIIIAPEGSALHNLLFAQKNKQVIMLTNNFVNPNYYMIDSIKNNDAHYINSIMKDTNCTKKGSRRDVILVDPEKTKSTIKDLLKKS
jgi:capsular polysaccharide biosynthesis protein